MLPEIRTNGNIFSIPEFSVVEQDVSKFMEELKGFHTEFRDCFARSESRDNFFKYMVGQFSQDIARKSIEPIALKVVDAQVRPMQRFVSDVIWDQGKIKQKYRSMVNDDLGDPHGVLIFDETGFVKKGDDSAGVSKQYCGSVGKVENCQVGVFAGYASRQGYCLLDSRLFIPEKWFSDDYAAKRAKCQFPEGLQFQTKPQLAIAMLQELEDQQSLPFKYVVADTIYGNSPDFIEAVENCVGITYLVSVPNDALCWLKQPITRKKTYQYQGQQRTKTVIAKSEKKPLTVTTIARHINDYFWYRRQVSEGTKGPIAYEFTKMRVVLAKDGLPWKQVWLIIKRSLGERPEYFYYISNAPLGTRLKIFVWLSGVRWAIEQCFEETKTELGLDHYEVRKFPGWHHHMLTCMLAHFFLWHIKIRLGKKSTSYYAVATEDVAQYCFTNAGI
jgi:SRSO17 transposase